MTLILNGEHVEAAARSVADLVEHHLGPDGRTGVAVAVNDAVVPRSEWSRLVLREGDRVEIVRAVQGG